MEDRNNIRRIPLSIVAGLSTVILVSGGAAAWWTWHSLSPRTPIPEFPNVNDSQSVEDGSVSSGKITGESAETLTQQPSDPSVKPAKEQTGQVYWLKDVDGHLELVPQVIKLPQTDQPEEKLKVALNLLMTGPTDGDSKAATTVPPETQILSLTIESDGIHIDFSEEFGLGGGSASMSGRLGQVLYTATMFAPESAVWISIEGESLVVLGGEGIEVFQPMTRADFEREFEL
ncbi:MAG: GerMN domain-containing protein [Leptolyngbyaceae cyanobacterium MO_188.B28]|nr:GerMN domain-containing protein [Leptolyngbyaceae cyanobacterium MO_188.B28]